ncbi:MAG TPA: transglycosylase SLT domain-containing protein [Candidatus Xenobia bacterium]
MTTAGWAGPSVQLSHYQYVGRAVRARTDVPLFNIRHSAESFVNTAFEFRGMVNGTMEVNGDRSFILQVGQDALPLKLGRMPFTVARGTSVYVVARILPSGMKVPPDMELVAYVPTADVVSWQEEQERLTRAAMGGLGSRHHFQFAAWPQHDPQQQRNIAVAWIRSFNPALPEDQARGLTETIFTTCQGYHVDPRFTLSLMAAESAFQVNAVSRCGAQGLGQLMPGTAARLGVRNAFDPVQNIQGCVKFLNELLSMWGNSSNCLSLVLASYNAGPGAVQQFGGIPPYQETQSYVSYVLSLYRELGGQGS